MHCLGYTVCSIHLYISHFPYMSLLFVEILVLCTFFSINQYYDSICSILWEGGRRSPAVAGLLITGSLVRTHSGASFVINFASLSPASAWPSLA